jgi:hypothetical protein
MFLIIYILGIAILTVLSGYLGDEIYLYKEGSFRDLFAFILFPPIIFIWPIILTLCILHSPFLLLYKLGKKCKSLKKN